MSTAYKVLFFGFVVLWASAIRIPHKARREAPRPLYVAPKRQCSSLMTVERPDTTYWETLCTGGAKPWDSTAWSAPRPEP